MRKLWALACVVGLTAFLIYGFVAIAGALGDRPSHPMNYVLCALGLFVGALGWKKVMEVAPRPSGKPPAARARLDAETDQHLN